MEIVITSAHFSGFIVGFFIAWVTIFLIAWGMKLSRDK